ncbi:hypothetical protein KFE25_014445 [Diacronema lutheri]|uniref:Nucleoside diphosphate kinase n=2 Tax=Diacronema lutheri TaxID=2081491 RepID=A0A8J5X6B5_DIALT|nr:hypothetical protein KFE25_014445 [Diacronema lutheri]
MERERSVLVIAHEGVQRKRVGALIGRLEARGLKLVSLQYLAAPPLAVAASPAALARARLDARGAGAAPVVVAAVEGDGAVLAARAIASAPADLDAPVAYAPANAADAVADLAVWLGASGHPVTWASHAEAQLYEQFARGAARAPPPPKVATTSATPTASPTPAAGAPPASESAAAYLARHRVEAQLDEALNLLVSELPAQPYEWLAAHFLRTGTQQRP